MVSLVQSTLERLNPASILVIALGALFAWYIASSIVAWHRLRKFSGPSLASFSYWWGVRDPLFRLLHTAAMSPMIRSALSSNLFLRLAGPKATDKDGIGRMIRFLEDKIDERFRQDPAKRPTGDMLDEWMKHGLSSFECKMDMALQIPAGSDTSVTSIRGCLLYLMSTPAVYRRLKDEICQGVNEGRISDPCTHEEAKKLPLLNAMIYEGMRLTPAFSMGFSKLVPPGGDVVLGHHVPAGTEIYANLVMLGQHAEVFGPDVDVFRPERFLEGDAATRQRRISTVELAFGAGRYLCLGKSLVQIEMRKLFVELLRRFDFQIVNPERPWKRRTFMSTLVDDYMVRVTRE